MMDASPRNVLGSASQLFYQDKKTSQYAASVAISSLPHPNRSILESFFQQAVDPEKAASYLLRKTSPQEESLERPEDTLEGFLIKWRSIVEKFRPVRTTSLPGSIKSVIYERDGGTCSISNTAFKSPLDVNIAYTHIIPPLVFNDPQFSEGTEFAEILSVFMSEERLEKLRTCFIACNQPENLLHDTWLLDVEAFKALRDGQISFEHKDSEYSAHSEEKQAFWAHKYVVRPKDKVSFLPDDDMVIHNRTPRKAPIVEASHLSLHARFAPALTWIDMINYIDTKEGLTCRQGASHSKLSWPSFLFLRRIWRLLPAFVRSTVYDCLIWVGLHLYGPSLSMTVFKLPFGLYLRKGSPSLRANYEAEFNTLSMVEKLTKIPAPRPIDIVFNSHRSYLLMTRVPGRPIGQILYAMTDEQIGRLVTDLKGYISELRQLSSPPGPFQICNSLGGGILDWRIPDSQREELRFKSETEFNKYLTDPFWDEIRQKAAVSHDIKHEIVFTHGDLNMRNILGENGRVTGIVDWENAGWYPEYWEFSKAHYTVRSRIYWLADVVDRVFEGYREELWVDNMLSDLYGPY